MTIRNTALVSVCPSWVHNIFSVDVLSWEFGGWALGTLTPYIGWSHLKTNKNPKQRHSETKHWCVCPLCESTTNSLWMYCLESLVDEHWACWHRTLNGSNWWRIRILNKDTQKQSCGVGVPLVSPQQTLCGCTVLRVWWMSTGHAGTMHWMISLDDHQDF